MAQPARDVFTEQEYLAMERESPVKHELIGGRIYEMSGASMVHNLLKDNIAQALREALRGRPCVVLTSDQRVHIPATGLYTYPDVVVLCGRPERHRLDEDTLLNPVLLVEVLSPSTEAYDRGAKASHYRSLPSLAEYLLVSQSEQRVEHYRRVEEGRWLLSEAVGEGGVLTLPVLSCELALRAVYENLELVQGTAG